jgi:hypothetical protein
MTTGPWRLVCNPSSHSPLSVQPLYLSSGRANSFPGNAIIAQFPLHEGDPEAKKLALKLLGVIVQSVTHKDWIRKTLKTMFDTTDHSNEEEKLGCAQGFGYAASAHLDTVLEQQTSQVKAPEPKKESGGMSRKEGKE